MGDGNPEVIPPSGDNPNTQSIVVNQFIQLVNKNNTLPEGEALARYTQEDKEWIKVRVEYEQEQRIALIQKLVDHQQEVTLNNSNHEHKNSRHRQTGAMVIIGISVVGSAVLLYLHVVILSLGLPAVIMIAPVG